MAKTGKWLVLLLLVILLVDAAKAFLFKTEEERPYCPPQCKSCKDTRCNRRGRCSGVAVSCLAGNFDVVPGGIPPNVTALRLSRNHLPVVELGDFDAFKRLSVLLIDDNNATELRVAKRIRKLEFLNLKGNRFESLPKKELLKLRALTALNLDGNLIESVRGVRFPRKLEILNLNNNRISELIGACFRKVKFLRVLKLNNNLINSITQGAFKSLGYLEVLEMAGNRLIILPPEAFSHLVAGFYLNLKNNEIGEIHPTSFRLFGAKNHNRHQIILEHNRMQFINMNVFAILAERNERPKTGLFTLYLAGNPLFCDCNFLNLRNDTGPLIADQHKLICNLPPPFEGVRADQLYIESCCY